MLASNTSKSRDVQRAVRMHVGHPWPKVTVCQPNHCCLIMFIVSAYKYMFDNDRNSWIYIEIRIIY